MISKSDSYGFSTEAVIESYRKSDLHRTLALLHGRRTPAGCGVIRAMAYLKLQNFDRAREACNEVLATSTDRRERVSALMIRALYLDFNEADAYAAIEAGIQAGVALGDPLLEVYCLGHRHRLDLVFRAGPPDDAALRAALARAKRVLHRPRPWYATRSYAVCTTALQSLAIAYASAGDVANDRAVHLEALSFVATTPVKQRDFYSIAGIAGNLGCFLRRSPEPEIRALVEPLLDELPAAVAETIAASNVRRALLVNDAIFHDENGSRRPRGAEAPTLRERTLAAADALLFRGTRNVAEFRAQVLEAVTLADRTDWYPTGAGNEEILLVGAAVAPHDLPSAKKRAYVPAAETMYDRVEERVHSHHRAPPFSLYEGMLAKAEGRLDDAAVHLGEALSHWRTYGDDPLSAIAGIERFSISRDPEDLRDAERLVNAYPGSSMARRMRAALARAQTGEPGDFPYLRYGC